MKQMKMDTYTEAESEESMSTRYVKSGFLLLSLPSLVFILFIFTFTLGFLAAFPPPAQAYLDPGSGSMLLQILLGGTAGLAVLLKLYWHRLLLVFGVPAKENAEENAEEETQAAARPE